MEECYLEKNIMGFYYLCDIIPYPCDFLEDISLLCSQYLLQDWHNAHEELIKYLELAKQESCIDNIVIAIDKKYPYFLENEGYEPFVRRCIYALIKTNTPIAIRAIIQLSKSSNQVIAKYAQYQMSKHNIVD